MQRRDGSRRVAAEAVAPLHSGDDALEVGAVEQLGELQEAVAQHEELGDTKTRENSQSRDQQGQRGRNIRETQRELVCSVDIA